MSDGVEVGDLRVDPVLLDFIDGEVLPAADLDPRVFWAGTSRIIHELAPLNRRLIERRRQLQSALDEFHRSRPGAPDPELYREFLTEIGYLEPRPSEFTVTTDNVDSEITQQAGPQLVVPLLNARFATNAANARWGSLYDAMYGTDVIPDDGPTARGPGYNEQRGAAVIAKGREVLDEIAPLDVGNHRDSTAYFVEDGRLVVSLSGGQRTGLTDPSALIGYVGDPSAPQRILLRHHGLHAELQIDRAHRIGSSDAAGLTDIVLESAVTAIMDLEDSVAAVDGEDKTLGYRNWLRLMDGTLTEQVTKNGETFVRRLAPDRQYTAPDGGTVTLHGRSLLFIRHVGHLMTTDAVTDRYGDPVPEGILDAIVTAACSTRDIRNGSNGSNSRTGSMYIVKPKMHGSAEVAFTVELFRRVEELLGLPPLSLKLGIMDEERRTTVNLAACIAEARDRVVFINTGFLDRTGDEIHTSLRAGAFARKGDMPSQVFISAYEDNNVDVGIASGLPHRAQIGKGMWAKPDLMRAMLEQKGAHPRAGATTAWVPSPTAATLHALHYHQVDAFEAQRGLADRAPRDIDDLLHIPLAPNVDWTPEDRRNELDNNVQSILGYVVRWVDQGIGCSKVPDLSNVALMEDRATLRISSQLLANWLAHGIISSDEVAESMERIASVVDEQNAGDPLYESLIGPNGPSIAFQAARDLILLGADQPNGYTEPILHTARRTKKQLQSVNTLAAR